MAEREAMGIMAALERPMMAGWLADRLGGLVAELDCWGYVWTVGLSLVVVSLHRV